MDGIQEELTKLKIMQRRIAEINHQLAVWNSVDEVEAKRLPRPQANAELSAIFAGAAAKLRESVKWLQGQENTEHELHHINMLLDEWETITPDNAHELVYDGDWLDRGLDCRLEVLNWFTNRVGILLEKF